MADFLSSLGYGVVCFIPASGLSAACLPAASVQLAVGEVTGVKMVPAVNSSSGAKSKDKSKLIGRVNFPLCTIDVVSERHVFVAGGGGRAKTGVPNKMVRKIAKIVVR